MQNLEQVKDGGKLGIVLLNMGGPKTLDDIRPFLYNLFVDPDIIDLPRLLKPLQKPIAWLIAKFRTPTTTEMYRQIGNGSPILEITSNLAEKIATQMTTNQMSVNATVAMRYTYPRAKDAIEQLQAQQIDQVILFSQYPHQASYTTGSSLNDFYQALEDSEYQPRKIIEIKEWGTEPEYITWWTIAIRRIFEEHQIPLNQATHLIFSAHGLPQRYVDQGEKYPDRIREAAGQVMREIDAICSKITSHVSFQSQAGPVEWTKPYTDELIRKIAEEEGQIIVVVPLGFVSNHVETLYELDILYRNEATENGILKYYRVDVPDDDDHYAMQMAELIGRRLEAD